MVPARIFFCFRLLKRLQNPIADANCISESLQSGRELWELIMAKVTMCDPRCYNQNAIAERNIIVVLITDVNTLCIFIDSADIAKNCGRISLMF